MGIVTTISFNSVGINGRSRIDSQCGEGMQQEGLYGELEDIQTRLSVCEKALTESIETKRLAFPCFYYISSADLLDVLSNGTMWFQLNRNLP